MNRISLLNYGRLPILATRFWAVLATNDAPTNFNKVAKIEKKDLYAICYFSHAYNRTIKSDLEITYKESRIEENARSSIWMASSITRSEIMSRVRVSHTRRWR